jgi:hypothetical protein
MMTSTLRRRFSAYESAHQHEYFCVSFQSTVFHCIIIYFNKLFIQYRFFSCPSLYFFRIFPDVLPLGVFFVLAIFIFFEYFFEIYFGVIILIILVINNGAEIKMKGIYESLRIIYEFGSELRNILSFNRNIDISIRNVIINIIIFDIIKVIDMIVIEIVGVLNWIFIIYDRLQLIDSIRIKVLLIFIFENTVYLIISNYILHIRLMIVKLWMICIHQS